MVIISKESGLDDLYKLKPQIVYVITADFHSISF